MDTWTFLTNHGHVLLCIASDPDIRMRDIAVRVGITERSAQRIVADLTAEGYVEHAKVGRRNRYLVRADLPLRHPIERANQVGELLKLIGWKAPSPKRPRARG
jgi:DNA-binding Lrp family transcriptional regulator